MQVNSIQREAIQDSESIVQVLRTLGITNAELLATEIIDKLGVATAFELKEVLLDDPTGTISLLKPIVRCRIAKSPYFKVENPSPPNEWAPDNSVARSANANANNLEPPAAWTFQRVATTPRVLTPQAVQDRRGILTSRTIDSATGTRSQIHVACGDIVQAQVDGVVNAANSHLQHAGGVAAAIARANAPRIQQESDAYVAVHGPVPVGSAVVTCGGGQLKARWVIHAVGPLIAPGRAPTAEQRRELSRAVRSALDAAKAHRMKSVAIPAISTGIFNFPVDLAATLIVEECMKGCATIDTIYLCDFNRATAQSLQRALTTAQDMHSQILTAPPSSTSSSQHHETVTSKPQSSFKAAGVLLARYAPALRDMEVLLAIENRSEGRDVVNFLGGQRDAGEVDPKVTAARECSEETAGLVAVQAARKAIDEESASVVSMPFGKYLCYVAPYNRSLIGKIDVADAYNRQRNEPLGAEASQLVWVPWRAVAALASKSRQSVLRLRTTFGDFKLSDFVTKVVRHKDIMDKLNQGVRSIATVPKHPRDSSACSELIAAELCNLDRLRQLSDKQLLTQLLGVSLKTRLQAPPLPPPAPIQVLKSTDPLYQSVMTMLPEAQRANVVQVRACNVTARQASYDAAKKSLQQNKAQVLDEFPPFFHGTPEGWRATAIAMNGFDLKIRLCGRALGDGVYSSKDVNTAFGYCGAAGSVLVMKGLVVASGPKHATTIVQEPVYVFPDARCVLPVAMVDFADATDATAPCAREALDLTAVKADIEQNERTWCAAMLERSKRSLQYYEHQMRAFQTRLDAATTQEAMAVLSRQIAMEQRQFADKLPMYALKAEVIQTLQHHRVVVMTASTGSGKSTQLPQLLLDHVIDSSTDQRTIAVLEPRRANAVSLARRVAAERMSKVGEEVGYALGRNERESSSATRIEFMTHGLFAEIASNPKALVERYCAVVLDEAHERGVDVDLSLAFLRQGLALDADFRVVVTSATIPKATADQFQAYLNPTGALQSIVYDLDTGPTFPVQVMYQDEMSFRDLDQSVGGFGTSKVLGATATQLALDIVQQTTDGHVLIFVAGEAQVNRAVEEARAVLAQSAPSGGGVWESLKQQFYRIQSSKTDSVSTVGVYPFHGKLTRSERDAVLQPQQSAHRMIIFTTNVAETGITIPGVRYVIDTGYERRVAWNANLNVPEMVSSKASQMSLHQRRGRAGRDGSGICVRLFKESDVDAFEACAPPAITQTMKLRVILRLLVTPVPLMDAVPQAIMDEAIEQLKGLGTVDDHGAVTDLGHSLLQLGCSIRLGRFLIACEHFGCLDTGVKIASGLLLNTPAALLPPLKQDGLASSLVDATGDHMTIYNVVSEYDNLRANTTTSHDVLKWCTGQGICQEALEEARETRQFLTDRLTTCLKYVVQDRDECQSSAPRTAAVLKALCAAFSDQFAVLQAAGNLKTGLSRLRSGEHATDVALRCASNSTLWNQPSPDPSRSVVVYDSILLIDGDPSPSIQVVSYVSEDHVLAGAPNWCEQVHVTELLKRNVAQKVEIPVSKASISMLRGGRALADLRREFRTANFKLLLAKTTERDSDFVEISARPRVLAMCRARLDAALQAIQDEVVERVQLDLPPGVSVGKFIGKDGANLQVLRTSVTNTLDTALGTGTYPSAEVTIDKVNNVVVVELRGKPKALLSVIIGCLQTNIYKLFGQFSELGAVAGDQSQHMLRVKHLRLLTTQQAPAVGWSSRDDVFLHLAHAIVWNTPGYIYGGFVRDWVINGESARDIDVGVKSDSEMQVVVQVLAQVVKAHRPRMQMQGPTKQANAHLLVFSDDAMQVRVDLVNHSSIQTSPPGVDTDAGNVCIKSVKNCVNLYKRIDFAGGSVVPLEDCVRHIQKKEFVLFYNPSPPTPMILGRLQKYLHNGWTCLSPLPPSLVGQLNVSRGKLAPQSKYNQTWWNPPSVQ